MDNNKTEDTLDSPNQSKPAISVDNENDSSNRDMQTSECGQNDIEAKSSGDGDEGKGILFERDMAFVIFRRV